LNDDTVGDLETIDEVLMNLIEQRRNLLLGRLPVFNLQQFNEGLKNEDRSYVVYSAAVLDDKLKELLRASLLPIDNTRSDPLFAANGPLSSSYNCMLMAKRLNLITESLFSSLNTIRQIRNKAAHEVDFDLGKESNVDRVNSVIQAMNLDVKGMNALFLEESERTPTSNFHNCIAWMLIQLEIVIHTSPPVLNSLTEIPAKFS
jgi:hypothetical protein